MTKFAVMKKGFIAGNFDLLHPGYIKLFKECRSHCDHFTVLLHTDPSIERPHKFKPILSIEERKEQLASNRYIDAIQVYTYEKDLEALIEKSDFDLRFLGNDYEGKPYTGDQFNIPVHYLSRDHGWSTTKLKQMILDNLKL